MNISDHKKNSGKTYPGKLKNRIREFLRKSTDKTAKRAKQAETESRRALQYAGILSRMVQCDTTSHPYSDAHPRGMTAAAPAFCRSRATLRSGFI